MFVSGESGMVDNEEGGAVDCCAGTGSVKATVVETIEKTTLTRKRRIIVDA
jgi:hypothetical protein